MTRDKTLNKEVQEQIRDYNGKTLPEETLYPELAEGLAMNLRIIRDMNEFQHTCYIEVCSEKKKVRSCWNKGALYFTIEGFEYLEPIIKDVYPCYSQHSFQCLTRDASRVRH